MSSSSTSSCKSETVSAGDEPNMAAIEKAVALVDSWGFEDATPRPADGPNPGVTTRPVSLPIEDSSRCPTGKFVVPP